MDRKFWLLRGLRFFLFAALFVTTAVFFTQYLWNWLMPDLFHLPAISLAQTFGLLLLSRIFFGFRGGRTGSWGQKRKAWQQRMAGRVENLSPEAREKFRQQMQNRCGSSWVRRAETAPAAEPTTKQPS